LNGAIHADWPETGHGSPEAGKVGFGANGNEEGAGLTMQPVITQTELDALRRLDTCTVSNAIETFNVRLHNTGFSDPSIHCVFKDLPPMVGYAATARLRSGDPPVEGGRYSYRSDWWAYILSVPAPRVVVIQDMDEPAGLGALLGDVHAAILQALGCVGFVTNGAVRELPRIHDLNFPLFAGNVAVSHAYAHIFALGAAVTVGGLDIFPGDLLQGDAHGLLNIPKEIASKIPAVAAKMREKEDLIIKYCQSKEFSVNELPAILNKRS
jgi:4-hydroxy-4-methyl-2-oxoglutarate aldolase